MGAFIHSETRTRLSRAARRARRSELVLVKQHVGDPARDRKLPCAPRAQPTLHAHATAGRTQQGCSGRAGPRRGRTAGLGADERARDDIHLQQRVMHLLRSASAPARTCRARRGSPWVRRRTLRIVSALASSTSSLRAGSPAWCPSCPAPRPVSSSNAARPVRRAVAFQRSPLGAGASADTGVSASAGAGAGAGLLGS